MVIWCWSCNINSLGGVWPMNDKLLTFTIIIFFAGIIINGLLLMISATPSGAWIVGITNPDLQYDQINDVSLTEPNGFISNTSQSQDVSSFNPFSLDGIFAGVKAFNFIIQGLFLLEFLFWQLSIWFPVFSPILLAVAALFAGSKLLLIGYGFSVLLKALTGGR